MNSISLINELLDEKNKIERDKYLEIVWNKVWDGKGKFNYSELRLFKTIDKIRTISLLGVDFRDKQVLDIGCGDGTTLMYLQKYFNICGVGVDVSNAVVNKLKNNIVNNKIKFDFGDHRDLKNIASNQFDIVLSFGVIEHFTEYSLALAEARRILKDGGQIVLIQPHLLSFGVLQEYYLRIFKKWKFGRQKDFSFLYYKSLLKQLGFKEIKYLTKSPYKDMRITRIFDSLFKLVIPCWGHYLYLIAKK
jgi:ubiquinone/menaquinone biosynthesis C-methylase UbiE